MCITSLRRRMWYRLALLTNFSMPMRSAHNATQHLVEMAAEMPLFLPGPALHCLALVLFPTPNLQAIDFWLGSVIMHIWEYINKDAASKYGIIIGAGLLVGDGLWAIPSSIVAIFGKAPPICMGFVSRAGGCNLPYCIRFWLGGSDLTPGGVPGSLAR